MRHIPYSRQTIDDSDIHAVTETLTNDFLTQGPQITAFEEALKRYLKVNDAILVSNGTAALHLSYLALDLQGSTVFTTPITFAATANMLHAIHANIRFVDVDPLTGIMSVEALKEALEQDKTSVKKAIVPVSLQGIPADLPAIQALAQQYNAFVVEDAAHSLGGEYSYNNKEYKSASCAHSDLATLSFHPLKTICCAEGGAVTTNNSELAQKVRLLRNHGLKAVPNSYLREQCYWGYNYRMTDLQAALGVSQLKRISYFLSKRRSLAHRYAEFLSKAPYTDHITITPLYEASAYHLFVIHFKNAVKRDFAYHFLKNHGIETQVHYVPLYKFELYRELLGEISLPGAETYYQGCLSIPIYPHLTQDDQDYVLDILAQCCQQL